MGRSFSSIRGFMGGMSSVSINGHSISINSDEVFVDGVLNVPADAKNSAKCPPKTAGKIVSHDFQFI